MRFSNSTMNFFTANDACCINDNRLRRLAVFYLCYPVSFREQLLSNLFGLDFLLHRVVTVVCWTSRYLSYAVMIYAASRFVNGFQESMLRQSSHPAFSACVFASPRTWTICFCVCVFRRTRCDWTASSSSCCVFDMTPTRSVSLHQTV
jgi:hypothetical protein